MRVLYDLSIFFYRLAVLIASVRSAKARTFLKGRKNWREKLQIELREPASRIWVHVASLGEYEQSLPVIERLHSEMPDHEFVLTFFSPSGYEHAKLPDYINKVFYLPIDTASNASVFLDIVNPSLILFVKYDIWYHYLSEAKRRNIKSVLFSALFRKSQSYFKWHGGMFRLALKSFDLIYVQNDKSQKLLKKIGIESRISGDTRFDRVKSRMQNNSLHPLIASFAEGEDILVVGSSWMDDLEHISGYLNTQTTFKVILAPHNIGKPEINSILEILQRKCLLFSDFNENTETEDFEVLIIDNIGMLASVYAVGKIAYVGGAFHGSLHNILEPAVFGMPVIFGPKHKKFPEARAMINAGAAFDVNSSEDFQKIMKVMEDEKARSEAGKKAADFVDFNLGSSQKIVEGIKELIKGDS